MLGRLKGKVLSPAQNGKATEELIAQFKPLETLPGASKRLAERLAEFITTGQGESVVAELTALNGSSHILHMGAIYHAGAPKQTFTAPLLVELLPEDPAIYLRLAKVYEAANNPGAGLMFAPFGPCVPAFEATVPWLTTFLTEFSQSGTVHDRYLPARLVQQMLVASNEDPMLLVRGAFFYEDTKGKNQNSKWYGRPYTYFQCLEGFPELVLNSIEVVRPAFHQKDASSRACVLQALVALKISVDPFVDEIALLAVSGSKEVRENAEYLVAADFSKYRLALERHAEKGSSDERYHAVRLLARLGGPSERAFLTQRLDSEKSAKVAEAIRNLITDAPNEETSSVAAAKDDYALSEAPKIPIKAPLDKAVLRELRTCLKEFRQKVAEQFAANSYVQQKIQSEPTTPDPADKVFDALQNFVIKNGDTWEPFAPSYYVSNFQAVQRFAARPEFELIHLVRWCLLIWGPPKSATGWQPHSWCLGYAWREPFVSYQKAQKKPIDLRELAAVFQTVGLDDRMIGEHLIAQNQYFPSPLQLSDPDAIWPYFSERLDLLEEALGLKQTDKQNAYADFWAHQRRDNAFKILQLFPRLPASFIPFMWEVALGKAKTERPMAQQCLEKFPNKEQRILAALAGGQQDARLAAAQWLADLDHKEAIPALRKALSKEKSEFVKDEIIKALETLGVKLEELLDLAELDRDAEKGLKKGIPKELEWFPFSQLPPVRWADSGQPVNESILHWFIVQGHKLNTAEAGPGLRRYCSLFNKEDREQLGKFVMEAWIAQDTKPKYTAEQAAAEAQRDSQQMAVMAKQYPQYYVDFDQQRVYQAIFNRLVVLPEGSQTATKGILAVAGACCGGDAAPIVHRYVKQWYGYRGAQSKALLQVLAWIEHPSATQVVLSVANRFRTKGIQEEAMRLCELLAVRKGWTLDELADRTIPTTGFDEDGTMELDYGSRKFTATLSDEMAITLVNPNGKTIASLPDANQSDDAEKAKQSKATLSTARKELKTILAMQKDRLYEALCTQRVWTFEDWDTYLRKHPIVGRYCQRLVWVAYDGEKVIESFRPLADGTLTNHRDDEVSLKPATAIRLGHDATLNAEDRTAWLQHFSDYKVEPLFQQFGKPAFVLSEEMNDKTEITDFLGHIVKAFSLRNRLTKLGYTRGAAEDAGWFYSYRKTFMRLGIEAVIDFTGNGLPEENRTVALQRLCFVPKQPNGGPSLSTELPLSELPAVLLAECWNDIRMAAAEGSGFAADWQKQTEI